jgi:excisionase family DNA binding protein
VNLLTAKEACAFLRISRVTLYKKIQTGQLRAYLFGRAYKFRQSDLDAYLDRMVIGR